MLFRSSVRDIAPLTFLPETRLYSSFIMQKQLICSSYMNHTFMIVAHI